MRTGASKRSKAALSLQKALHQPATFASALRCRYDRCRNHDFRWIAHAAQRRHLAAFSDAAERPVISAIRCNRELFPVTKDQVAYIAVFDRMAGLEKVSSLSRSSLSPICLPSWGDWPPWQISSFCSDHRVRVGKLSPIRLPPSRPLRSMPHLCPSEQRDAQACRQ